MPALLLIRTVFTLSALPGVVLLILASLGRLAWADVVLVLAVLVLASVVLARIWVRDLSLIVRAMQPPLRGQIPPRPLLAAAAAAADEAERLARLHLRREEELSLILAAEQAIIQALPDPLIVLAADRSVRRANEAAQTAFGSETAAVLRHPLLRSAIDRAQAQGETQTAELRLTVPVEREVVATVMALNPALADGGRVVALLSDRTRERAVERMRADFVANASHELRTPLASLIGFIDTLRGPAADDSPAQTRFLGIMAEQALRMNRLIDDLLSLSRIELTEHQPPADVIDIGAVISRLAASFEPQVTARRIVLSVDVAAPLAPIRGDDDQMEQVLQNLLDNAVKYGREGGAVRVTAGPAPPGTRWPLRPGILVAVSDDGQGIARAHIPRLTERFYRVDKGRSRAVGGTGLGLAIVKHIVIRHRGQLVIESAEGVGTTVTVWLPEAFGSGAAGAGGAAGKA